MPKFDWNQFPAEQAQEKPAGKFDWNQFPAEGIPKAAKEEPKGPQVYDQPVGPEQASAVDRFAEKVTDPLRWQAILTGKGPYAPKDLVAGTVPMALPAGAPIQAAGKLASYIGDAGKAAQGAMRVPELIAKPAIALAEGKGLGYAAGRTALSGAQGAGMSVFGGEEGESWQDKIDRAEKGGKLSAGIQAAAEAVPIVGKALGYAARKAGSAATAVDESIIQNYANRTDEVNDLIKQNGGDVTAMADQVRTELSTGIQNAKKKLNTQIAKTLAAAAPEPIVPIKPLIDKLEAVKSKLNPNLKADAISEIDEMISIIKREAGPTVGESPMVNVSSLYQLKQFLQENAKGAYAKGGQIFTRSGDAARAAREAGADARLMLKPVAGAISEADSQLSRLHQIESRLNKNLLAPGKPDAALLTAGSGANARNAANLRALGEVSGVPVMQRAKDLATAKTFANPSVLPTDTTGKALARVAVGAGIGGYLDGKEGAAIGGAMASPMALKLGVNTLSFAKGLAAKVPSFGKFTRENPVAAQTVVQLLSRQVRKANAPAPKITPEVQQFFEQNPKLMMDVRDPEMRAKLEKKRTISGKTAEELRQPGAVILYQGKHYRVGPDGDTLTPVKGGKR